jgi:hypothetical protein
MILLQPDCLVFKTSSGENIPCSAQQVTVELIGQSVSALDDEVIRSAAESVLQYFKQEIGKTVISVGEFSQVLERVLRGLGYEVRGMGDAEACDGDARPGRVVESDLSRLAGSAGRAYELEFYPKLRAELKRQLDQSPRLVRFSGLRPCVKHLTGAKRWSVRCQALSDQIVNYLRVCLASDSACEPESCALLIS